MTLKLAALVKGLNPQQIQMLLKRLRLGMKMPKPLATGSTRITNQVAQKFQPQGIANQIKGAASKEAAIKIAVSGLDALISASLPAIGAGAGALGTPEGNKDLGAARGAVAGAGAGVGNLAGLALTKNKGGLTKLLASLLGTAGGGVAGQAAANRLIPNRPPPSPVQQGLDKAKGMLTSGMNTIGDKAKALSPQLGQWIKDNPAVAAALGITGVAGAGYGLSKLFGGNKKKEPRYA